MLERILCTFTDRNDLLNKGLFNKSNINQI